MGNSILRHNLRSHRTQYRVDGLSDDWEDLNEQVCIVLSLGDTVTLCRRDVQGSYSTSDVWA